MEAGFVGLGRMGAGLRERARRAGHRTVGFDANPALADVPSLAALVDSLDETPRVIWLMLPAGEVTGSAVDELLPLLAFGDILVDGGNSYYRDSVRRAAAAAERAIRYLDIGTSGGVWGLENGFCLMVGGPREAYDHVTPLLDALAADGSYRHLGESGAGHYAKMIHNGVEYGVLQALAEGFDLLHQGPYDYDLGQIARLWNQNSVVRSWLLGLASDALAADADLSTIEPYVEDSGEGRWTVAEAVDLGVSAPVLTQALYARFASRDPNSFAARMVAALRSEFGGHGVRRK